MRKWILHIMLILCMCTSHNLKAQVEADTTSIEEILNNTHEEVDQVLDDTSMNTYSADEYDESSIEDEETDEESEARLKLRSISEEDWNIILKDTSFHYKKNKEELNPEKEPLPSPVFDGAGDFFNSGFFKLLLYLFIAGVLLFVMYSLFSNGNLDFKKMWKRTANDPSLTNYEHVTLYTEWDKALMEALKIPDYRLAVRIHYLSGLQDLNEKGFIKYELEKTNWTYVYELSQTDLNDEFVELTKYFDYIWYGEFKLNAEEYQTLKSKFTHFKNRVR